MTRKEISTYIKTGVALLRPATRYDRGRISEFNSNRSEQYPVVWHETSPETPVGVSLTATQLPIDAQRINLHFGDFVKEDAVQSQYEDIIDDMDRQAQRFMYAINNVVTGYSNVLLSDITRTPFVKKNADCIAGVILSFNLQAADMTDNCVDVE